MRIGNPCSLGIGETRREESPLRRTTKAKQLHINIRVLGRQEEMAEFMRTRELVSIRYFDHVLYHRASALAMKPQIREAVGWLMYACDEFVTIAWDHDGEPPTLRGGDPKASGLVLLTTDILELKRLGTYPLQENPNCHLNSAQPITKDEYALPPKKRKTQERKRKDDK
jgi:hypothetical protein